MNAFRPVSLEIRENKLVEHPLNFIAVELEPTDITRLLNPSIGRVTARFMEFEAPIYGWAPEDKVHVTLRDPELPEDQRTPINLSLDPGGDMYFTIWKNERLKAAETCEEFINAKEIIRSDRNDIFTKVGLSVVRFYNLPDLNR